MRLAFNEANLAPDRIDYLTAHGTSTADALTQLIVESARRRRRRQARANASPSAGHARGCPEVSAA